ADRIQFIDEESLKVWRSVLETPETPVLESRMVYTVNTEAAAVLAKLARAPRISERGLQFSSGWHESADKKRGYFDTSWQHPDSWSNVILQGPHLGVSTPMIKQPNPTMKHNQDWSEVDIEAMHEDFIPATAYFPNKKAENYGLSYGTWSTRTDERPSFAYFRGAWRSMLATTGFRSAYPAIIPPGPCHVDLVVTGGPISNNKEISGITFMTSILLDFYLRSSGASHLRSAQVNVLPFRLIEGTTEPLASTFLRLNCLTSAYAPLWEEITGTPWPVDTPIRK